MAPRAGLIHIGTETTITAGNEDLPGQIGYSVNSATGEYVFCHAVDMGTFDRVFCTLYNAGGGAVSATTLINFTGERVQLIDADVAANGNFFLAAMTMANDGSRRARIAGWNRNGAALFGPTLIAPALNWFDVALTATATGPWFAGTGVDGIGDDIQYVVHVYNNTGAQTLTPLTIPYNNVDLNFCNLLGNTTDIAANGAGDVAFTWIKPSFPSACRGTMMVRTLRASGTSSVDRQLSATVRDNQGRDVSPNRSPHVVAINDDRFVSGWTDGVSSLTAMIDHTALILTPATVVLPGDRFELGGDPATGDYVVSARTLLQNGECRLQTQLAFQASLAPQTRFDMGSCFGVGQHAVQLQPNGQLGLARSYFDRGTLTRIDLPAQIEVNNVTVSEGNPGPGTPPSAALDITLTRPHPNGENVRVSYYTRNGTAVAGQDYALTQDSVVFDGTTGQTAATILLPILPDLTYEDNERFTVEFEQPEGAVIRLGEERSNIIIDDDDRTPPIVPQCDNGNTSPCRTIPEPDPGLSTEFLIHLRMAAPVGENLAINYTTVDDTAHAGSDYVARSGTVQIAAGATEATIALTILGDTLPEVPEDAETFHVRLSAPEAVQLTGFDLVVRILDDELCYLQIDSPGIVAEPPGSIESFQVETRPTCQWTIAASDPWIEITSSTSNTGPGIVVLDVAPFDAPPTVFARTGSVTVTLADPLTTKTIAVDQNDHCSFTVDPATVVIPVEGGTGSFDVDVPVPECHWVISSPVPWISILSPLAPVAGSGTVQYIVDDNAEEVNAAGGVRTTLLTSEQFDYTVSQDGCSYALDQSTVNATAAGDDSYFVNMDSPAVCRWTAVSLTSWILVQNGTSGSGDGPIEIFVLDNPTVMPRTGSVMIGNQTLTVNQAGLECDYTMNPASVVSCPDGRVFTLDVTATDGCAWTLHENEPWVAVIDTPGGEGSDVATGMIDINPSESPRNTSVELRAQNIAVTTTSLAQEGYVTFELFDGSRPTDWQFTPDASWTVSSGNLVGRALDIGNAVALDQDGICSECEIETSVALTSLGSTSSDVLTVLGWYVDANNHVGLSMNEFGNRWTLFQRVAGTRFSVSADVAKILPNTFYDVRLVFDGTKFVASVGGQSLLQLPLNGSAPSGKAGLGLVNANGRMSEIRINRVASSVVADPEFVFRSGFEATEGPNLSLCRFVD